MTRCLIVFIFSENRAEVIYFVKKYCNVSKRQWPKKPIALREKDPSGVIRFVFLAQKTISKHLITQLKNYCSYQG